MRPTIAAALLLSLTSAACGPDDPAEVELVYEPIGAADFAQAYADAVCGRSERCFSLAPSLVDECKADILSFYAEDIVKGVAAGRLVYDADMGGRCVAGAASTPCLADRFDDPTEAACYGALLGTIAQGEPCYAPFECLSGICGGEMTTTCPAICPVVLKEGDSCSLIMGASCDERAGVRCSGGVCVKPAGLGAPCVDRNACNSGLVCGLGECSPLREEGQGCAGDSSCEPGLACVAEGDEGGICKPRLPEGALCGADLEDINAALLGTQCGDGLLCKGAGLKEDGDAISGVCSKPSPLGGDCLVEPAGLQTQISGCLYGLHCPAGKCEPLPESGPCGAHSVCFEYAAYCDMATNECNALKADGQPCAIDRECAGGACIGDACVKAEVYCHEG